ncbi:MAG: ferritin-like domain-containing protein [Crocosphaera sp.]|nr:ferritin-like domain-containing protein [Crocosphaera sp.]
MVVSSPGKLYNGMNARHILKQVVSNREIHLITINRYRYNEQHSCKDLTDLIEKLNGQPKELVQDLSRHVCDEARHAMWLTDLLVDLGADIGTPPGVSYIDEFDRLIESDVTKKYNDIEEVIISALAAINITEKRGCEYFSAHLYALKEAPPTEENIKIRETLEKIFPEEVGHVSWGNKWLSQIAKKSPQHRQKVEEAKRKYTTIENAAYNAGMDVMAGAELRRFSNIMDIVNTLPLWERPEYLIKYLPQSVFDVELQKTRLRIAQKSWNENPQEFLEKFVPMFLNGLNSSQNL